MQQTLLTLGALMIITMISVGQQRSNYMVIESIYVREQESAAYDYATMRLEHITSSMAFDESMADGETEADISIMAPFISFGPESGESQEDDYDDVDDYHGYSETINHVLSADTFRFDVSYAVQYVDPVNPTQATSSPTFAKELTVSVVSRDTIGMRVAQYTGTKLRIATQD